jgi:hypothetical protein
MADPSANSTPNVLFPTPSRSPSSLAPTPLPGINYESTSSLLKALKDNHKRWHVFFNDKGFHK